MECRRGTIERALRVIDPDFIERNVVRINSPITTIDKVNIKLVTNVLPIDEIDKKTRPTSQETQPWPD